MNQFITILFIYSLYIHHTDSQNTSSTGIIYETSSFINNIESSSLNTMDNTVFNTMMSSIDNINSTLSSSTAIMLNINNTDTTNSTSTQQQQQTALLQAIYNKVSDEWKMRPAAVLFLSLFIITFCLLIISLIYCRRYYKYAQYIKMKQ